MAIINQKIKEQFEKTVSDEMQEQVDKFSTFSAFQQIISENLNSLRDINDTLVACEKIGMKLDIPSDILGSDCKYTISLEGGKFQMITNNDKNGIRFRFNEFMERTISIEFALSAPIINFYKFHQGMAPSPTEDCFTIPITEGFSCLSRYDHIMKACDLYSDLIEEIIKILPIYIEKMNNFLKSL